jgi:hypothetical protein
MIDLFPDSNPSADPQAREPASAKGLGHEQPDQSGRPAPCLKS